MRLITISSASLFYPVQLRVCYPDIFKLCLGVRFSSSLNPLFHSVMVAFVFKILNGNRAILQSNSWTYGVVSVDLDLVTRGNLLYWSVCSDNDDAPCVFSLPACYCCFLSCVPARYGQVCPRHSTISFMTCLRSPGAITANVVVRREHRYLLREACQTAQLSFLAPSLLEAS